MAMRDPVQGKVGRKDDMRFLLKQMMQIRAFEDKVFELLARDILKGASHVYAGQEAVAVGAMQAITDKDLITSTHRGHGHCLARGGTLKLMLAELCGKETGYCRGRGGTGIVAGNIPVATGAALACKMRNQGQVVLCFFGDGASNNGTFHESLNMAGVWKLPIVYIIENNLYGMSVSVKRACAVQDIATRSSAYAMDGVIVDGQRVLDVQATVAEAVKHAREGKGPMVVEAKTYRYRGHSRSDPRVYRTKEEEAYWHDHDPIKLFRELLAAQKVMTEAEMDAVEAEVDQEMAEAEKFTLDESAYPPAEAVFEDVYAGWIQGKYGLEPIQK